MKKYSKDKKVIFNEDNHTYYLGNKKLISVTQYISKYKPIFDTDLIAGKYAKKNRLIKSDVINMWKQKGEQSRNDGTFVHKIFEDYILGNKISINNDIKKSNIALKIIEELFKSNRLYPIETEYIVYNKHYAGQIDCIAKNNKGDYFILDWKTNKNISYQNKYQKMLGKYSEFDDCSYIHYSIQLEMYKSMIKEYNIKKCYIVHIKDSSYEFIETLKI